MLYHLKSFLLFCTAFFVTASNAGELDIVPANKLTTEASEFKYENNPDTPLFDRGLDYVIDMTTILDRQTRNPNAVIDQAEIIVQLQKDLKQAEKKLTKSNIKRKKMRQK